MGIEQMLEIQLKSDFVARKIAIECQSRFNMAVLGPTLDPNHPDRTPLVISRVQVSPTGVISRGSSSVPVMLGSGTSIQIAPVELKLPFAAFLKKSETLLKPDSPAADSDLTISGSLVVQIIAGGTNLEISLARVELPAGVTLPFDILKDAQQGFGRIFVPIEPWKISFLGVLGVNTRFMGFTAGTPQGPAEFLALRIEFNQFATVGTSGDADWIAFFGGQVPDRRGGADWALLLGKVLFERHQFLKFQDSLLKSVNIHVNDDVTFATHYSPGGSRNGGHLLAEFSGTIKPSVCLNRIHANPVHVDVDYFVESGSDGVQSDAVATWSLNVADVLLCGLPALALGAEIDSVVQGILQVFFATRDPKDFHIPPECHFDDTNPSRFHCTTAISIPDFPVGSSSTIRFGLTSMRGDDVGPVLLGTLFATNPKLATMLTTDVSPIQFGVIGGTTSCAYSTGYRGGVHLGDGPAMATSLRIFDDKLGLFSVSPATGTIPMDVDIDFRSLDPTRMIAYFEHPYIPALLIQTGIGAASVRLNKVVAATPEQQWHFGLQAGIDSVNCKMRNMSLQTGFLGVAGQFDPHWHVDPPWDQSVLVETMDGQIHSAQGRVRTQNPQFSFAPQSRAVSLSAKHFQLPAVLFRWQGIVNVTIPEFGEMEFRMDTTSHGDFVGELPDRYGTVNLTLATMAPVPLEIPTYALPPNIRRISVDHRLHPGHLQIRTKLAGDAPTPPETIRGQLPARPCGCPGAG